MAYQQYQIGQRGNTLEYNTAEILRQLRADGDAPKVVKKGPRKDKLRLAQLYGSGIGNVRAVKGRLKPILKGDDSDYHIERSSNMIDYGSLVEGKLNSSSLFYKHGIMRLEQLWSGSRMTIADLIKQFHQHYDVALTRNEAAGLAKQWGVLVTEKKKININFNHLLTKLYALHEAMRKKRDMNRKEEEEQLKKRKDDRVQQRPNVPGEDAPDADEIKRRAGLIQLQRGLYKLNIAVPQLYMLEPKHFLAMVNKEVHGALTAGLLRDFCRFNLRVEVSTEEAAALLLRLDYGAGRIPLSTWLYELKKLGLGMSGLLDPIVLDFESAEAVPNPISGGIHGIHTDAYARHLLQQDSDRAVHPGGHASMGACLGHGDTDQDDGDIADWDHQMAGVVDNQAANDSKSSAIARIPLPAQLVHIRIKDALPAEAMATAGGPIPVLVDGRKKVPRRQNNHNSNSNSNSNSNNSSPLRSVSRYPQHLTKGQLPDGTGRKKVKNGKLSLGSPTQGMQAGSSAHSPEYTSRQVQFETSSLSITSSCRSPSGGDSPHQELEELSVLSNKILETSKIKKYKYNFHSSGISIPRMDPAETDRVLSKKQHHSPNFERNREHVVRVSAIRR